MTIEWKTIREEGLVYMQSTDKVWMIAKYLISGKPRYVLYKGAQTIGRYESAKEAQESAK